MSSRKYFEQKSVAKVAQSIETFKFRTVTVINRGWGCVFAPLMEKRCINILKVRNLGKQYAHQIWSHTVQNPWRHVHVIMFVRIGLFGKIAQIADFCVHFAVRSCPK